MVKASVWAGAMIALLATTGCAGAGSDSSSTPHEPRRCFWSRDVRNFRVADSTTVNIRVGRDVYRLDLLGSCPNLNWTGRMGLVTTGSSSICTGSGLGTSIVSRAPTGRGQQRCAVRSITPLSPEQVKDLPRRTRP